MPKTWNDIAKDWENIPLQTFEFIFSQAKDRLDDCISESVSITEKSIGLCKITVAIVSVFIGYNFKHTPNLCAVLILSLLFIINFTLLIILMFPKDVKFRGSPPEDIYRDYLDNKSYTVQEKTTIVYHHEIIRYQERIDFMKSKTKSRQEYYKVTLILTATITILFGGIILQSIFVHP